MTTKATRYLIVTPTSAPYDFSYKEIGPRDGAGAGQQIFETFEEMEAFFEPYRALEFDYEAALAAAAASTVASRYAAAETAFVGVTTLSALAAGPLHALSLNATQDYVQQLALVHVFLYQQYKTEHGL